MMLTPANVVKGCRRIEVHCGQHAIGDQRVETSTLVHFIEVRKRATREQLVSLLILDWRTICIVQQTLDQVQKGNTILQPLLVLNANCIAAETCSGAGGGGGRGAGRGGRGGGGGGRRRGGRGRAGRGGAGRRAGGGGGGGGGL